MLEKNINNVINAFSGTYEKSKDLSKAMTIVGALTSAAILPACDNNKGYPSGQDNFQKIGSQEQIIDLGNGNRVEIKESNGKISVQSIVKKDSVENPLELSHTQASRHFNKVLEKYFKDMNSYYRIKPGSLIISDSEGVNYSLRYEVELMPVQPSDKHIRYTQTADSVGISSSYTKAQQFINPHIINRSEKVQKYFEDEFVNKVSGQNDANSLCEAKGYNTQVQTVPMKHKGADNGNNIAFGGNLVAGVCIPNK